MLKYYIITYINDINMVFLSFKRDLSYDVNIFWQNNNWSETGHTYAIIRIHYVRGLWTDQWERELVTKVYR